MNPVIQGFVVLFAAYFTILLLGFQSKLMRDNRWQLSFFMTWMITFAQVATTWSIANNHLGMPLLVFLSGLGGSLGIVSSHFLYLWYDGRKRAGTDLPDNNKLDCPCVSCSTLGTGACGNARH